MITLPIITLLIAFLLIAVLFETSKRYWILGTVVGGQLNRFGFIAEDDVLSVAAIFLIVFWIGAFAQARNFGRFLS